MNNRELFLKGQEFKSRNPNKNELQGLYLGDRVFDWSSDLTHSEGRWRTNILPSLWRSARI